MPTTTTTTTTTATHNNASNELPPIKIVAIGAGFSGLSVAYHLLKQQHSRNDHRLMNVHVQILEARHRIGGRVHPQTLVDNDDDGRPIVVDLGAQWVHEASGKNPIRRLMKELDIPFHREGRMVVAKNVLFDDDGKQIDAATVRSASKFFHKALNRYRESEVDIHTSFQSLLDKRLRSNPSKISGEFSQVITYKSHQVACYEGGKLDELSVHLDEMYRDLGGSDEYPKGGYNNVLTRLVEKIGSDKIRLGCVVESIVYDDNGVTLTVKGSDDDDDDQELIHCDYCVCTVPLGVLQKRAIRFVPELPDARWNALDAIGMGLLDKIVLRFDRRFWPKNCEQFGVAHSDPARIKSFLDCSSEVGAPVLIVFLGGDAARRIDSTGGGLSDDEAVAETMSVLRFIFSETTVPDPVDFAVTRWLADPFSFGAYSFVKVGCTEDAYDAVATPIGRVLFAGEHTSKTSHSTVHGAWESGQREAKRLLRIIDIAPTR